MIRELPVVWAEETLRHVPGAEIRVGVRTPGTEVPERATVLRDAVVHSLGVDAAAAAGARGRDPESPLRVTPAGYARSGRLVADLGAPVVAVHEGGYRLPTLGAPTVAVLEGRARRPGLTAPATAS